MANIKSDNWDVTTGSKGKRRVCRLLLALGMGVVVVFGWLTAERLVGKAGLTKYERVLRAKGEKMTIAELIPTVLRGENGADEVIRLCGTLQEGKALPTEAPPPQMRMVAPGKAMRGASRATWLTQEEKRKIVTNDWEMVSADLELNQQTLDELRSALKKPVLHKRLNYEAGFKHLDMNHLMALKRGGQWLAASGMNQLRLDHSGVEDIEALVALVRMQDTEHLAINQLVRWAIQHSAVALTWEGLEGGNWNDAELQRIQQRWMELDFINPTIQALRMERAMGRLHFDDVRQSVDELAEVHGWRAVDLFVDAMTDSSRVTNARRQNALVDAISSFVENDMPKVLWKGLLYPVWQFSWSHRDQRQSWLIFQTLIDGTKSAREHNSDTVLAKVRAEVDSLSEPSGLNRLRFLLSPMSGTLANLPKRSFQQQTHGEMVICAIALERYKLKHGTYPNRLDDLVPEVLMKHPIDYVDGGKLRYRQEGDNFMLWSVGADGKDDGGNPGMLDKEGKPQQMWKAPDAVWPRPALEEEIQEFEGKRFER